MGQDFAEAGFIVESGHGRIDSQLSKIRVALQVGFLQIFQRLFLIPEQRGCLRQVIRSFLPFGVQILLLFQDCEQHAVRSAAGKALLSCGDDG